MKIKKYPRKKIVRRILLGFAIFLVILIGVAGVFSRKVYVEVKQTAASAYQPVTREKDAVAAEIQRESAVNFEQAEPFSVLLLGVDSATGHDNARSDTMILATVNPAKKTTTLVSLERDTYVNFEKLNAAYAKGGAALSMDTVSNLLEVPIDHYITLNFNGLEQLVDSVGGITVNNPFAFTYEETDFAKGSITLNGATALKFSRMRYEDPDGNYGRQKRQRLVIAALAEKLLSINSLATYTHILNAVGSNVATDLTFNDMTTLATKYRTAFGTIKQDQLQGTGFMQDGISYQAVSDEEFARVSAVLKEQLEIE